MTAPVFRFAQPLYLALAVGSLMLAVAAAAVGCSDSATAPAADAGYGEGALKVGAADTVVVSVRQLGTSGCAGLRPEPASIRLAFATARATRTMVVCPAKDGDAGADGGDGGASGSSDGGPALAVREAAITPAQRDAIQAAIAKVTLVDAGGKCAGFDGTSYSIEVERPGGATESYTDGISYGCDVHAKGLATVFAEAQTLFP